jgi:integrase
MSSYLENEDLGRLTNYVRLIYVSLVARKLGFPKGVPLHTLRHSHGSHLLSMGVPLPTLSKRLGHANTHITATVYAHALEKDEQTTAEVWERTMGNLGKKAPCDLNSR